MAVLAAVPADPRPAPLGGFLSRPVGGLEEQARRGGGRRLPRRWWPGLRRAAGGRGEARGRRRAVGEADRGTAGLIVRGCEQRRGRGGFARPRPTGLPGPQRQDVALRLPALVPGRRRLVQRVTPGRSGP